MTSRFAWAIQHARSQYPDWDWMLEESDFGATVKLAGRKGETLTDITYLSKHDSSERHSIGTLNCILPSLVSGPKTTLS